MAFNSPSKIPRVEGEEFGQLRDQFCLLAYSALDAAVHRQKLHQEVTDLGQKVMRKFGGMSAERKFLRKELYEAHGKIKKLEGELEVAKAALDFAKDDALEEKAEEDEAKYAGPSSSTVPVEQEEAAAE